MPKEFSTTVWGLSVCIFVQILIQWEILTELNDNLKIINTLRFTAFRNNETFIDQEEEFNLSLGA